MPKAAKASSTPRQTASKIKVKKIAKSASAESEEQRNLRHAEACRGQRTASARHGARHSTKPALETFISTTCGGQP